MTVFRSGRGTLEMTEHDMANSERQLSKFDSAEPNNDWDFVPARFPSRLGLPEGAQQPLSDAAAAVQQEFNDSSQWKQLNCRKVSVFAERDRGTIYVVHLGKTVEFDWAWEGAKAFCPLSLGKGNRFAPQITADADYLDDVAWSGEIVEVDEQNGCLFIALENPEATPTPGRFFVRPFEFLSVLNDIYNSSSFETIRTQLPDRLQATEGNIHPQVSEPKEVGLPHLKNWWRHSWSILWGPPGTGKTWPTGRQVAEALSDESERILIVSTTNKATDAVALALGEGASEHDSERLKNEVLLRIGKGASYQTFLTRNLEAMLAGTESETLSKIDGLAKKLPLFDSWEDKALTRNQISKLKSAGHDRGNRIFVDPEVRVVVSTAFKAVSFLKDPIVKRLIEKGDAPFTTILIDEAGLISRTAIAALSLLAARRVVLVGDPKQLAPISRISRVLPTRQQTWLASSGLSHLAGTNNIPRGVHLLSHQRRMHPDVAKVISDYQYDGALKTAEERIQQASNLPEFIAKTSRTIWYVLDEENCELADIRASRGPGNRSWVRRITQAVLQKLFTHSEVRQSNGLFISPYKAQAQAMKALFAERGMDSWEASTVHSQQGSEADIVIFDTVNAGSQTWDIVEWKRLVNVALSRAREAVIVLASRNEIDEPYLRSLKQHLTPLILVKDGANYSWFQPGTFSTSPGSTLKDVKAPYRTKGDPPPGATSSSVACCRMGDQFAARRGMKPILSQEQQRLTNLSLDGKPRLVRGVAGSGKSVVLCNWLAKTARKLRKTNDARIWAVYANRSLHKLLCDSIESAWKDLVEDDLFESSEFPWEKVELLHVKDVLAGLLPNVQLEMHDFGFDYDRAAEEFLNRHDSGNLIPRCSALFIDEAQDMGPSTLKLLLSVVEQSDESDSNSRSAHIFYDNAQNVYDTKTPKWSEFGLDLRGRSTIMREGFRSTRPISELAVNVLQRLSTKQDRQDHRELISLGLLKETQREREDWLEVRFSQVTGPSPIFHRFQQRSEEMKAIARHLRHLTEVDGIAPTDICILYNGRAKNALETHLAPLLKEWGIELSFQKNSAFQRKPNTLLATTPHSYKGYESEVIIIPCVDSYVASEGRILEFGLYVAMTRARSLLAIYGTTTGGFEPSRKVMETIEQCIATQRTRPTIEVEGDETA